MPRHREKRLGRGRLFTLVAFARNTMLDEARGVRAESANGEHDCAMVRTFRVTALRCGY